MVVRRRGRNQPWCNAEKQYRQREELIQKFRENSSARLLCRCGDYGASYLTRVGDPGTCSLVAL